MRYFFDIQDGKHVAKDDIGVDCLGDNAARVEATRALTEMASDYLPSDGLSRHLAIHVRSNVAPLFSVDLQYSVMTSSGRRLADV